MKEKDKQKIFDLLRDHTLRPRGYDNTVHNDYIVKAHWSPYPVYRGLHVESRCILGVLSTSHHLLVCGRRARAQSSGEGWTEPWEILLNITANYNHHLLKGWEKEDGAAAAEAASASSSSSSAEEDKGGADKKTSTPHKPPTPPEAYKIYKRRMFQLAITNFIWLPEPKLGESVKDTDEGKGVFTLHLLTFHRSGDVCIWKISSSSTLIPQYCARVLCIKKGVVAEEDSVGTASYFHISPQYGLLLLGTNRGKVTTFVLDRKEPDAWELIPGGCPLWEEEDMIKVENILVSSTAGRGARGAQLNKVDVVIVKNPNIILAAKLTATAAAVKKPGSRGRGGCKMRLQLKLDSPVRVLKVGCGPVSGIVQLTHSRYILSHEPGVLSLLRAEEPELLQDSSISIFDVQKSSKHKPILIGESVQKNVEKKEHKMQIKEGDRRLVFLGLALSPNKVMIAVAKTIGVYYDHLQIRKPTHIVFYSLMAQQDELLKQVGRLYRDNDFSMRAISDALVPFRHFLSSRSPAGDALVRSILEWASEVPLDEKSTEELRLLYWCLKGLPQVESFAWDVANAEKRHNPQSTRMLAAEEALHAHRVNLVVDRIIQRRCRAIIQAVHAHPDKPEFSLDLQLNKQSLIAMHTFLSSKKAGRGSVKEERLPPIPEFASCAEIPLCHWCKGPIEFPLEQQQQPHRNKEFSILPKESKCPLDKEVLSGWGWRERRHPVKESGIHAPEICILSLLPLKFPYRRCRNCKVPALMEPSFGQLPYCPLCGAMMYPILPPMDPPLGEENETEDLAQLSAWVDEGKSAGGNGASRTSHGDVVVERWLMSLMEEEEATSN